MDISDFVVSTLQGGFFYEEMFDFEQRKHTLAVQARAAFRDLYHALGRPFGFETSVREGGVYLDSQQTNTLLVFDEDSLVFRRRQINVPAISAWFEELVAIGNTFQGIAHLTGWTQLGVNFISRIPLASPSTASDGVLEGVVQIREPFQFAPFSPEPPLQISLTAVLRLSESLVLQLEIRSDTEGDQKHVVFDFDFRWKHTDAVDVDSRAVLQEAFTLWQEKAWPYMNRAVIANMVDMSTLFRS